MEGSIVLDIFWEQMEPSKSINSNWTKLLLECYFAHSVQITEIFKKYIGLNLGFVSNLLQDFE